MSKTHCARSTPWIFVPVLAVVLALQGCGAPAATSAPAPTDTAPPPATATSAPSPAPTATETQAPTPSPTPTAETGAAYESACLDCHLDRDRLIDSADPEPTVVAENQGEG